MTKFIVGLLVCLWVAVTADNRKVVLKFQNDSHDYLSVHWVNPTTQATSLIKGDIEPRSMFTLNSYLSHTFEVRQQVNTKTGLCGSGDEDECDKKGHFQVTQYPEQGEPNDASLVLT